MACQPVMAPGGGRFQTEPEMSGEDEQPDAFALDFQSGSN
jgi:hypothetical protein